jgi:protein tyrosine phosphatase
MFNKFFSENRTVCDINWKTIRDSDRLHIETGSMRTAYRIPKAKNTQLEYVKLVAFALQQWLGDGASMLRLQCVCMYVAPICFSLLISFLSL